jgi:hypothetical protein
MADDVRVRINAESDLLEVRFSDAAGCQMATSHDAVIEGVDKNGPDPAIVDET